MTRPYEISRQAVYEAFKLVKANAGAAGVDGESLTKFGDKLENNLYKIWNRMSSGSYFPPAGQSGSNTQEDQRGASLGSADRGRPSGADGGADISGTACGAVLPTGLLRLPTQQIGPRCAGRNQATLLAIRLGAGIRHRWPVRCARLSLAPPAGEIPAPARNSYPPGIEPWAGEGNDAS